MAPRARSLSLLSLGISLLSPVLAACSTGSLGGSSATAASVSGSGGGATGTGGAGQGGHGGQGGQGGHGGAGGGGQGGADPCAKALFCDDFEAYAPGGHPGGKWSVNENNGSVTVDGGKAHSGGKSAKVSAGASQGYRSVMLGLADKGLFPVTGNVIFGRMMFFLESAPTGTVHWTFIDGEGPVPGMGYHALYRYGGQLPISNNGVFQGSQLMANYDTPDSYQSPPVGPSSDCWLHSDKKLVPTGAWACAEWRFDGPKNQMQFWLDGTELPDLAMNGTGQGCVHQDASFAWTAPSFERIDLGWESYQPDDARTMWIDDVVLSTERVGCPAP